MRKAEEEAAAAAAAAQQAEQGAAAAEGAEQDAQAHTRSLQEEQPAAGTDEVAEVPQEVRGCSMALWLTFETVWYSTVALWCCWPGWAGLRATTVLPCALAYCWCCLLPR